MKGLAPPLPSSFPFISSMSSSLLFFILYRGVKRGHLYNHIALAADALVHIDSEECKATGNANKRRIAAKNPVNSTALA